jgi:NodT family efflux transporter outer membrane factor (OMF) lipoprotein
MAALLAASLLPSCAPKGVQVTPPVAVPKAFSSPGEAAMPEEWWTAFGDTQLDSLVEEALKGNFSLRVAWDRMDQARALAAKSGAPLLPSLSGTAGVSRSVRKAPHTDRLYSTNYSLGLVASYEVDLWGRVRSAYDASRLDVYASQGDLHAAAITLTAEVAGTWVLLIEQQRQLSLLDEQLATNRKYLEVITTKFRRGPREQVSATDVLQQQQLVEETKGQRVLVESSLQVLKHQLAVLLGRAPGDLAVEVPQALPTLPAAPRTGLPAACVRRRPDVRAAELRVQAADQRVAAAIADQFPKLGLSISAETSAEQLRDLFDNWAASLAANLVAPLFDAGLRRAEVERTKAIVSEQLHSYGQVVLTALREVEDALSQEADQAAYVASLSKQLELSRKSTDQTRANYTKTGTEFIRYLTTLLSHQRLQRSHLQAKRELVLFRIDLYRALAGSWSLPRPPRGRLSGPRGAVEDPAREGRSEPGQPSGPER